MTRRMFAGTALGFAAAAVSPTASPQDEAQKATEAWLAVVDQNNFGESWDQASALFKKSVTREEWEATVGNVRDQLGPLQSRTLTSATFTTKVPDAPEGEYVLIEYASSFTNHAQVVETVLPMKDPDGVWRVSGYYVR